MRRLAWLPQGRTLPFDVWQRRHRAITLFALIQAGLISLGGILVGRDLESCLVDAAVIALPALAGLGGRLSPRLRTASATVSLMLASAVLVDLANGSTEAHFHFFVMVGVVSMYQDWTAFGICILITVAHHAVMGSLMPNMVYGTQSDWQHPIRTAFVHGGFILAASATHLMAWKATEQQELSDPLTRLPNRTAFVEALQRRLSPSTADVSVLFIDLDNFKIINDSMGHHAGDRALQQAAARMTNVTRISDMVARVGGDEFAVLVPGDAEHGAAVGRRIADQLQAPVVIDGREVFVNASIGVVDSELADSRDPADLLRDADLAMYLAKAQGKNQVVTYTAGVAHAITERAALAGDIRNAAHRGEFEVRYQPLMRIDGIFGVEALLRWHHPVRGELSPTEFISLAEETGEIEAIGAWVLRTASAQVAAWRATALGCAELTLAVNLSPNQLRNPELVEQVLATLRATGLPPTALTIEVTEGVLLQDLAFARRQLEGVRAAGILVAIDDFGTGYSSLSYLANLPADQIKIDKSFTAAIVDDRSTTALVKGIIDIARALGLDILAEGVEETAQQTLLLELGCLSLQGYLYAAPLSVDSFRAFAARMQAVDVPGARLSA